MLKKHLSSSRFFSVFLGSLLAANVLAACTNNSPNADSNAGENTGENQTTNVAETFPAAQGCKNVGILLPETDTSTRWETYDRPLLEQEIRNAVPDVEIQYANANNNAETQQNQAESVLTRGACILVIGAKDSQTASAIVQSAKASGVPVIAYDRLIQDNDLAFYVSFDNVRVGEMQGQYIIDQLRAGNYGLKSGANVVLLNGSQTDNNALQFRQGALNKLQPLFDSGELNLVFDQYTPNWDLGEAQSLIEGVLTRENNNIQVVYAASDILSTGAIAALREQNLNGKVLVTGQDANASNIQAILTGDQSMTIYKPIIEIASATAEIVAALSEGTDTTALVNATTETNDGAQIPSALSMPQVVDINNIEETVIKDEFLTKEQICQGLPKGTGEICD
ncbi:sugar ABC transporter substrate-binding protein [Oscillatoria sp. FACHB-1407]|uniref:sugar ABC transporter substrate-binding protein n=1 Tax=Oscillatoria sp. FACHB-1407 TaxID=2692847 RepID=UPI0016831D6D|nr:sugar ABC transporter substrate-binding protein [Oscillatoria sp. FACHB-1407]MBD2462770.1 sugar ABC transporter substrate-binding protein [Oscillatoria sp. FACHB-1407]